MSSLCDIIAYIRIEEHCSKTIPCKHKCSIMLNDGRKNERTISAAELISLSEKISWEKIETGRVNKAHFIQNIGHTSSAPQVEELMFSILQRAVTPFIPRKEFLTVHSAQAFSYNM